MGKAFKILLIGGGVAVLVVALAAWYLLSNLDEIVRRAVERVGSETTGTSVTLDGAHISLESTDGALSGLTIANPPGFATDNAFEMQQIDLGLDLASLRGEEIVLREVTVAGAHLTFEQVGDRNNLQTLLDHVERSASSAETGTDPEDEMRMVIETFKVTGAKVTLVHEQLEEDLTFEIPDVVVRDIGRVGAGETASAVARQVLEPVLARAMDSAKDQAQAILEQRLKQELDDRKQDALDSLKNKLLDRN